ncbi:MAG: flagellar motor protein MotB [Pseudomonadales bacterium]
MVNQPRDQGAILRDKLLNAATDQPTDGKDRWMVSYADFMTLLFAFFVVMYSISSVNSEKYRVLSATLEQAFATPSRSIEEIQIGEPTLAASPNVVDVSAVAGFEDPEEGDTEIRSDAQDIAQGLSGFVDSDMIDVESNKDWLEISLNGNIGFTAGTAQLTSQAQLALNALSDYLQGFSEPITLEGYTDNVPIRSSQYDSNWLLSSARASAVATFLESAGIDRQRMSAVGYGENHSLRSNATPAGRAANRRVVVVVARHGNLARNLNATPFGSAFAFVRREDEQKDLGEVEQRRTASGGLLFSN